MRKNILTLGSLILAGMMICSFVSAEMLTSDAGVSYDSQIIDKFNNGSEWVDVFFRLNNESEVDNVLSISFENDFRLDNKAQGIISGAITKEGFEKLKNDSRIKNIYPNVEVEAAENEIIIDDIQETNNETEKSNLDWLWIIGIIFIILIIWYLIKKKK